MWEGEGVAVARRGRSPIYMKTGERLRGTLSVTILALDTTHSLRKPNLLAGV